MLSAALSGAAPLRRIGLLNWMQSFPAWNDQPRDRPAVKSALDTECGSILALIMIPYHIRLFTDNLNEPESFGLLAGRVHTAREAGKAIDTATDALYRRVLIETKYKPVRIKKKCALSYTQSRP